MTAFPPPTGPSHGGPHWPGPPVIFSLVPTSGPADASPYVTIFGRNLCDVLQVTFGGVPARIVDQGEGPGRPGDDGHGDGDDGDGDDGDGGDGGDDDDDDGGSSAAAQGAAEAYPGPRGHRPHPGGGHGTMLVVIAPQHAPVTDPTTVPVIVTSDRGDSNVLTYTYLPAPTPSPPTITSIHPRVGPACGGTPFVIRGCNLANAVVTFGPYNPATILADDANHICGITPAGPATGGTVTVTVTTPVSPPATTTFTYCPTTTPPCPHPINGSGPAGSRFSISGTQMDTIIAVLFNGTPERFTLSGNTICGTIPDGSDTASITLVTATGIVHGGTWTYPANT